MMKPQNIPTILISAFIFLAGCSEQAEWSYQKTISLSELSPLGIAYSNDSLWISAPDQKKIAIIDKTGSILKEYSGLERPMHISASQGKVYVPVYLEDEIRVFGSGQTKSLKLDSLPDAPAGVFVRGDTIAVADFYNHRIILQTDSHTTIIGKKGHQKGQLYYPTDVALAHNKIYVADAYNNRVQVFDNSGKALQIIGEKDGINVATGLTVYRNQLFVTDFFNNKILVYDLDGNLMQTLEGHFNKPSDIAVINNELYIPNYGAASIVRYKSTIN